MMRVGSGLEKKIRPGRYPCYPERACIFGKLAGVQLKLLLREGEGGWKIIVLVQKSAQEETNEVYIWYQNFQR